MRWVDRLVMLGVIATTIALGLGKLGRLHWQLELLSHFAVQYAIALAAACAYLLLRRRWRLLLLAVPILLFAAWPVAAYYMPHGQAPVGHSKWQMRVMSINVQASNNQYRLVRQAIAEANPDVVFLSEATAAWEQALTPLGPRYAFSVAEGRHSVFSVLLLSRLSIRDGKVITLGNPGTSAITARVCPAERSAESDCIRLVGVHPPPPMTAALAAERNDALQALESLVRASPSAPTVVLGDFNCTPWSPFLADLLAATGLRDSAAGFGVRPTWRSSLMLLGLKIDHVLVDPGVTVRDHRVGDYVGSDHYPVIADIAY